MASRAERRSVWWPARSSKPVLGGSPVQGGFDSHAAPPCYMQGLFRGTPVGFFWVEAVRSAQSVLEASYVLRTGIVSPSHCPSERFLDDGRSGCV
jgi:hypothetical protein